MSELRELYQQVILDHNRKPRNFRAIDDANHTANGDNPLCGDKLRLFVKLNDGMVEDISFKGTGCAISTASASMMTEAVKGKSLEDTEALFRKFHHMLTVDDLSAEGAPEGPEMGKLEAFAGVREFPVRVKCATLAWHTLQAALHDQAETTTE